MYEQIEKYLNGKLSSIEIEEFEKRLKEDSEFKKEFLLVKDVNNYMPKYADQQEYSSIVNNVITKQRKHVSLSILHNKAVRYAASIALLIGFSTLLYFALSNNISSDKIFNKYYQPYEISEVYRSESTENVNLLFINAVDLYNNNQYVEAAEKFSAVLIEDSENTISKLLLAICAMENNNVQKSVQLLESVVSEKSPGYYEIAQWYLGLSYIKTNQLKKAEIVFNKIVNNQGYYSKKASKILKKLS